MKNRKENLIPEQVFIHKKQSMDYFQSKDSLGQEIYKESQEQISIYLNQAIESDSAELCLKITLAIHQTEWVFVQEQLSKQAAGATELPTVEAQASTKAALSSSQEATKAFALVTTKPKTWVEFRCCLPAGKKNKSTFDGKVGSITQFCSSEKARLRNRRTALSGVESSEVEIISLRFQVVNVIFSRYRDLALANIEEYSSVPKPEYNGLCNLEKTVFIKVFTTKDLSLRTYKEWQSDTSVLDAHTSFLQEQNTLKGLIEQVIGSGSSELCLKCSQAFNQLEQADVLLKLADPDSKVSATLDASTKMGTARAADAMAGFRYMVESPGLWAEFRPCLPISSKGEKEFYYKNNKIDSVLHYCAGEKARLRNKETPVSGYDQSEEDIIGLRIQMIDLFGFSWKIYKGMALSALVSAGAAPEKA